MDPLFVGAFPHRLRPQHFAGVQIRFDGTSERALLHDVWEN